MGTMENDVLSSDDDQLLKYYARNTLLISAINLTHVRTYPARRHNNSYKCILILIILMYNKI